MVSLLVGHEAVYTIRYGLGETLSRQMTARGHDGYWPLFTLLAGLALAVLLASATLRQWRLITRARSLILPARAGRHVRSLAAEWRGMAPRLLVALLLLFLLQENIERILTSGQADGLDAFLAPDSLLALPTLALVAAVAAFAGALVRWREQMLEARVGQALRARRPRTAARAAAPRWGLIADACRQRWTLARRLSGRAPPVNRPA